MTGLPKGWKEAALDDLVAPSSHALAIGPFGSNLKVSDYQPSGTPLVFVRNIRARNFDLVPTFVSEQKAAELAAHRVVPGDVLVTKMGDPPGDVAIYPAGRPQAILTADCIKATPHPAIAGWYLGFAIESPGCAGQIGEMTSGVAQQKISLAKIRRLRVPLAPQAEQQRMVAAIEEAFSKLDAGEAALRTVRRLLKCMRDAVLAAAVTGRLVPQDPTDTPAAKFLADLGVEPLEGLTSWLHASWGAVPLWQLAEVRLGRQRSPQRATGPRMRPYLRAANVGWGGLRLDDVKEMSFTEAESETFELMYGDLLLAEASGSPGEVGKPAQYRNEVPGGCCFQNTLIRVRLKSGLNSDYYEHFFRHEARTGRFASGSRGVGIHHLGQKALSTWLVPVPPPEEQVRLVNELDRQLSFLDACESAVDAGLERSVALRRSVLKAAFEGSLVPQEPSDEPASVLLDRIRAERAAAPKTARRSRRTA